MAKNWKDQFQSLPKQEQRAKIAIFSGIVGILSNLLLFAFKMLAGWLAQSVSIMADAANSLADSASSFVTILGFHVARKPADQEHPYGHERAEYISGFVVAILIVVVGIQFLIESIQKIINPQDMVINLTILLILVVSALFKLFQGLFYKHVAKKIQSDTIQTVSQDSFNDCLMTTVILISILLETFTGWQLDGWIGACLALYIIYSGITSILSSISDLLGERPSQALIKNMVDLLEEQESILGYHDLDVHHYGPNKILASVHIEVDAQMSLIDAHQIIDQIEKNFMTHLNVKLVGHIDPVILDDPVKNNLFEQTSRLVKSYGSGFDLHDFHVLEDQDGQMTIRFDMVIPKNEKRSNEACYHQVVGDIHTFAPDAKVEIEFDRVYLLNDGKE